MGNALYSAINFTKLCLVILCLAHWCACLFNLIALEDEVERTWIGQYAKEDLVRLEWTVKYVSALYFR